MERRDFLKYLSAGGIGTALGILLGKKGTPPGAKLIPYLIPPEDVVPGVASWYASLCTECPAGCGVIVKVMDGRARKIEGNPSHPLNRGKLCARGQAALQTLYNPDRIKAPMQRTGERGEGRFKEVSWEEAFSTLTDNLKALKQAQETDRLYLLTSTVRGHRDILFSDFMKAYGSPNYYQHELFQNRNLLYANNKAFGINTLPHYDIGSTRYLLSFGADFSSTWVSPVSYSYGYGKFRQGDPARRGRLVQVEPRMSLTGANADEWVPVKPGTGGILALSIAYAIVESGHYKGADRTRWKALLKEFSPDVSAHITEVHKERVYAIAKEFARTRPSLALGGENLSSYENGVSGLVAVNILNHLAGNLGRDGGVIPNPEDFYSIKISSGVDFKKNIKTLAEASAAGRIKTLITHRSNPLFTTPERAGLRESMAKIPFIVNLSSFMDETTAMADLVLPVHTSLEDWGDDFTSPGVGTPVATVMQPAVSPFYNTRGAGDIFIDLANELGGKVGDVLAIRKDFQDYLKNSWKDIYKKKRLGPAGDLAFDRFWNRLLQEGGWWPRKRRQKKNIRVSINRVKGMLPVKPSAFDGDEKDYPFYLITYPQSGYLDGRGANLPWLQELPDPVTNVVWGTWVEINPATARSLGIKEGDSVKVESPYGKIKAPAYIYPGIRPDTIAIPIGQGHSTYGRYAKGRGANPIEILPAQWDQDSGAMALNVTRVNITKTIGAAGLTKVGASSRDYGRPIIETITPHEYRKIKKEKV